MMPDATLRIELENLMAQDERFEDPRRAAATVAAVWLKNDEYGPKRGEPWTLEHIWRIFDDLAASMFACRFDPEIWRIVDELEASWRITDDLAASMFALRSDAG